MSFDETIKRLREDRARQDERLRKQLGAAYYEIREPCDNCEQMVFPDDLIVGYCPGCQEPCEECGEMTNPDFYDGLCEDCYVA